MNKILQRDVSVVMKTPLGPIAVALLVGMVIAHLGFSWIWNLSFFVCCLFLVRLLRFSWIDSLLISFFFLLGFLRYWTSVILPQENIAFRATETPTETCFVGRIQSEMSDQFVLSVERILLDKMWLPTTGKTLVQGRKEKGGSEGEKYTYGDRIFILGELSLPRQVRNPGEWNYRNYLASQGIHALLRLKQEPVLVERNTQFSIWKVVYFLKGFLRQRIQNALDPKEQGLIQGLLLGERGSLSFDLKTAFVQTGTVHILAISGLHVGMIIFGVLFLLKFSEFAARLDS